MSTPATKRKCEVGPCPRYFTPGRTGANGRCSRCEQRRRRGNPDITEAEAQLAEARKAGEVSVRSERLIGRVRPELAELVAAQVAAGDFASESDLVNTAVAMMLGREDLA